MASYLVRRVETDPPPKEFLIENDLIESIVEEQLQEPYDIRKLMKYRVLADLILGRLGYKVAVIPDAK